MYRQIAGGVGVQVSSAGIVNRPSSVDSKAPVTSVESRAAFAAVEANLAAELKLMSQLRARKFQLLEEAYFVVICDGSERLRKGFSFLFKFFVFFLSFLSGVEGEGRMLPVIEAMNNSGTKVGLEPDSDEDSEEESGLHRIGSVPSSLPVQHRVRILDTDGKVTVTAEEDDDSDASDDDDDGHHHPRMHHVHMDTNRVEEVPAKEPRFDIRPLKSALKKPKHPVQNLQPQMSLRSIRESRFHQTPLLDTGKIR
jgi:hypothetical protein